ncbi:site-specific DNA-methyltransferase [Tessaracoccus lubricantis]|uniref:Site-specific DNA-methyltransferase n=1 Tax=Tessaracoccus lubricantis TaxID=545543 RepID=A0ABP9FCX1_9ACTN
MEKRTLHSPDLTARNIERIADLFPQVITESRDAEGNVTLAVDFDLLRQELSDHVVEGPQERYRLDWPGKRAAAFTANAPTAKTLRPVREESVDFDTTKNLFIEGDNLDALKLLQESYLGKVKLIYIDPPYNTGNDFVYEDDFAETSAEYLARSGQTSQAGDRLVANTEANGRFHSDWLSMMYPRLRLARNLLRADGVICVSIDDIERDNLGRLMDEVFGAENFVDSLIWKKRYGGGAKEKFFVSLHEYILVYARDASALANIEIALTAESVARYYTNKDANYDRRGPYRTHPLEATKSMDARPNLVYAIPGPSGDIWPERQWLWGRERALAALNAGELEFVTSRSGNFTVHTKQYLRDEDGNQRRGKPFSIIDDVYTQHGTNEMLDLFGDAKVFPFPKPTGMLRKLIDALAPDAGDTVLDLFAGSGSTAHALMAQNVADSMDRPFVMVQMPETSDIVLDSGIRFSNVAELSRERIRRAAANLQLNSGALGGLRDLGFRTLVIDSTNLADVTLSADATRQDLLGVLEASIKAGRSGEDLLFQVLLDWGLDLSLPIVRETVDDREVFSVDDDALIACFAESVTPEVVRVIAQRGPLRAVFRDDAFESDAARINAEQVFREVSPATEVRTI